MQGFNKDTMMTDTAQQNNTPKTGLDAALARAKNYSTVSINSAIHPCPITDSLVYIVPTRYAISEQQANYKYLAPLYLTGKEIAVRPLRQGYLYLYQPSSKLRQFTVTEKGHFIEHISYSKTSILLVEGDKGITVKGDEALYLMYCEGVPLTEDKFNQLNNSESLRQQHMQKVDVEQLSYNNTQYHSVPLDDAEQVMAELQPLNQDKQKVIEFYQQYPNYPDLSMYSSDYARGIAQHYQSINDYIAKQAKANNWTEEEASQQQTELSILINKYPKSQVNQAGAWSAYKWQSTEQIQTWLESLKQESHTIARQKLQSISDAVGQKAQEEQQKTGDDKKQAEKEKLDLIMRSNYYRHSMPSYLIVLNDHIGLMQDVERIQVYEAARHEQWINYNSVRTTIAGFIRNLTTTNPNELKSRLAYRFRDKFEPTDQQITEITALHQQVAARHQQYVEAYRNYLTKKPVVQMQLPYNEAKQHYKQGLPYQDTVEPNTATLDQDVAIITQPTKQYIPTDIFTECWDDICVYFYQKQQNIEGSQSGAEVNQRITTQAVNYWLDTAIPSYQKHLDRLHSDLLSNRASLIDPVYNHLAWRIDGTLEEHRECLDNVGYTCFMQQTATLKGVEQMVDYLNTEKSAEIFTLLITRGISIFENTVNIGARAAEFGEALSSDRIAGSAKMLDLLGDTIDPAQAAIFTKAKLAEALASTEQAANGKWGELMRSFSSAIIKLVTNSLALAPNMLNKGVITVYNRGGVVASGVLEPMQFIPVRALPALIMAWFSDTFKIEQQNNLLKVTGQKADIIDKGIQEFVREAPKAQAGQTAAINSKAADYYRKAGGVSGVVAVVMVVVNLVNAGIYFNNYLENPEQTEQQQAETWSAYLYAGSAFTGIIHAGYGTYLKDLQNGVKGEKIILSSMQGFAFTLLGGIAGGFGAYAAFQDSTNLSIQIAKSGNNVDPALTYRSYAANAQIVLYGTQAAIGVGLAFATLGGVISGATAVGIFTLCMGPIAWLLLAAGAVYLWAWSQQETPLQTFLSGCCWGTRPKYTNPTPAQLVDDIADLIKLLFKPTIISEYQLASNPNAPTRHYRDGEFASVYNRLKQLAIYLPAADHTAEVMLTLKAKHTKYYNNDINNIIADWYKRTKAQWIPHQLGQGIVLKAELDAVEVEQLEAHIYYTNPIISMYNKQIAEIAKNLQVEDYYFRIQSSGVEEFTDPRNCQLITGRDNLTRLTSQQLTPKV